ncbi:MAG: TRAP transporter substrate-binding protein [Veillonellales bacterium]
MRRLKWWSLAILVLFAASALLAGCGSSTSAPSAKKEIILKAADVQPEDYPTTMGLKYMAKLLDERSQGRIKMQVYAGAQLGGEKESIEMTQMGTIAINRVNSAPLVGFAPQMGVFSMPFLFRDADHLWKVLDGQIGKDMLKELEKSNLVGLGYYDSGARSFYTKSKLLNTPADGKGLKLRVQQSKIFVDMVNALGGSATPMGYGEVYSGLQTGIIDGAENNPPSLYSSKHYEVCKYYALDEHAMVPEVLMMSKKVWDSLSPEDQKLVAQCAAESVAYQKKLWADYTEKSLKELEAKGVTISKPDKVPFQQAVASMYEKYPEYKEVISQIKAVQ